LTPFLFRVTIRLIMSRESVANLINQAQQDLAQFRTTREKTLEGMGFQASSEVGEKEKPCHYIFDLVGIQDPVAGGYRSCYNLQVKTLDLMPEVAINVRPVREGSIVQETYDMSDPKHPRPIKKVHTHEVVGKITSFGYSWTGTKDVPVKGIEALRFKKRNPVVRD
jgi:hypothetical protein